MLGLSAVPLAMVLIESDWVLIPSPVGVKMNANEVLIESDWVLILILEKPGKRLRKQY